MMKKILAASALLICTLTAHAASDEVQGRLYQFQVHMAQQGNSEASFIVAQMNEEGRGTAQNLPEAINWYKKAAEQGHPDAAKSLERLESRAP